MGFRLEYINVQLPIHSATWVVSKVQLINGSLCQFWFLLSSDFFSHLEAQIELTVMSWRLKTRHITRQMADCFAARHLLLQNLIESAQKRSAGKENNISKNVLFLSLIWCASAMFELKASFAESTQNWSFNFNWYLKIVNFFVKSFQQIAITVRFVHGGRMVSIKSALRIIQICWKVNVLNWKNFKLPVAVQKVFFSFL